MPLTEELSVKSREFEKPFPTYELGLQAYLIFRSQVEAAIIEDRNVWRNKFLPNIDLLEESITSKTIDGGWDSTNADTRTRSVNFSIPRKGGKPDNLKLHQVDRSDNGKWIHDSLELTFVTGSLNYLSFVLDFSPAEQFGYKYWEDVKDEPGLPAENRELKIEKNIAIPTTPYLFVDFMHASPSIQKRIYELNPHGHDRIRDLETASVLFEFSLQKAIKFVQNKNSAMDSGLRPE